MESTPAEVQPTPGPETGPRPQPQSANKPRYVVTYLLWLFGGWFGLHRFYLRQWFGGLLYMCTFGFLGIGWLLDAFLIPRMLKGKPDADYAPDPADIEESEAAGGFFAAPVEPTLAPWAADGGRSLLFRLQLFFGGLFLLIAPMIVVAFAVLMQQWTLMAVMIGILLFTNFLDHVRQILEQREEQIKKLPFMKELIKHFNGFYDFYMEHRPRGFLFYLFYFPVGFLWLTFSKLAREELKLYLRVFAAIAAALLLGTVSSYKSVYGSYVPVGMMIGLLVANLVILFLVVLLYMMPTMTTAFALSLSGRRKVLMPITFVSMLLAVLVGAVGFFQERDGVTIISRQVLQEKLKSEKFVGDLTSLATMFLRYEVGRQKPKKALWHNDKALRERFRGYASRLAAGDQANGFFVFQLQPRPAPAKPWLVLVLRTAAKPICLFVASPRGRVYKSWGKLPAYVGKAMRRKKLPPFPGRSSDKLDKKGHLTVQPMLLREFLAAKPIRI